MRTHAYLASAETPQDMPRVHASGPDPDRILLFGSDIFVGRGVLSHEVAFPGYLARTIARETGRGVDVVIEAQPSLTMNEAIVAARNLEFDRYDAVMIDIGFSDAMAGTRPAQWAAGLEVLLHIVTSGVPASAHVFFNERPDPRVVPAFRTPQGAVIANAVSQFNKKSRDVIDGFENASFLAFPVEPETATDRLRTARSFEAYAATLLPAITAHLELEFMAGAPRSAPVRSEERRQSSVDQLHILDTEPEERYDRIVAQAQRLFGTEYAAFNIIDNDRRWSKSHRGPGGGDGVRSTEFCDITIHSHGGMIVSDASTDPRVDDNPFVVGEPHVRFYAGYPIEAPDGQRIGALCVYDTHPRPVNGQEEPLLRELATRIERELWANLVRSNS